MKTCLKCGNQSPDKDAFCSKCGSKLVTYQGGDRVSAELMTDTATPVQGKQKQRRLRFLLFAILNFAIFSIGVSFFFGKGCSSVEGTFVSKGKPAGDFNFVPNQCRSGQLMQFFGAVILGKGQQDGAVVAIIDPVKGKMVKVEVPGSCQPPDYEKCTEIILDPKYCSTYSVNVNRGNMEINDIFTINGNLSLDCSFPEGGSIKAKMKFSNCH
jgi:hypothetical protein